MSNDFVLKWKNTKKLFTKIFNYFIIKAFADGEPQTDNTPPVASPSINYEELIKQARKEEKDKLYPRITAADSKIAELTSSLNTALLEKAKVSKELETLKATKQDAESGEVKKLKAKITELEAENKQLKENTPKEEDIRNQIAAEYEVKLYIQQKITEVKDEVLSVFLPEITGSTKEEVDEAIKKAKEKTLTTKKDLGLVDESGNAINTAPAVNNSGSPALVSNGLQQSFNSYTNSVTNTKPPVVFPASANNKTNITLEQVRNLDPRSDEYKALRKKLGLR